MTKTVSAYEARTNLGELINLVYYKNIEVVIERMGKPMVKIVNLKKTKNKNVDIKKTILKFAGIWDNKDGKIIEKYAKKLRKTAKIVKS